MGTKNNPGAYDCYENAEPDEPMFVLLARDPIAARLVEDWAKLKEDEYARRNGYKVGPLPSEQEAKIDEALACARAMRAWAAGLRGVPPKETP